MQQILITNKIEKAGIGLYVVTTEIADNIAAATYFKNNNDVKKQYPMYATLAGDTVGVYDEIILIPKPTTKLSEIKKLNKLFKTKIIKETNLYMVVSVPKKLIHSPWPIITMQVVYLN